MTTSIIEIPQTDEKRYVEYWMHYPATGVYTHRGQVLTIDELHEHAITTDVDITIVTVTRGLPARLEVKQ